MTIWQESLANHDINKTLRRIGENLKTEAFSTDNIDITERAHRLDQIRIHIQRLLTRIHPDLIPFKILDVLNNDLAHALTEIKHFANNNNVGHLNNAISHAEDAMINASNLPIILTNDEAESLGESALQYREEIFKLLENLKSEKDHLLSEINDLIKEINEQNTLINKNKERTDNIINQFQEQYSKSDSDRRDQFSKSLDRIKTEFEKISSNLEDKTELFFNKIQEDSETQQNNLEEKAKSIIDELNQKKKDASDLVQVIGNIGVTGNYNKIASKEKLSADFWRWVAIGFMVVSVILIVTTAYHAADFDWRLILIRFGAAAILSIPAIYAARESSKHRINANRLRQLELELASIDPYLEKIDPAKKQELKSQLVEKFFGNQYTESQPSDSMPTGELLKLIKIAIENLTKR